jgi:ribose transport system ATP-binding protein
VKAGEIVGLAGLVGSGRTELAETIMGFRSHLGGTVTMQGKVIRNPNEAIQSGLVYVSEDRKTTGLHVDLSVEENATLSTWRKYGTVLRKKREQTASAENWRTKLSIKVPSVKDKTVSLSGGNQQKVSLAKWLDCEPKVMILDEPTRGVDVGSKSEIYQIIHEQAASGCGILMISSELPELIGMCHRILVMRAGQIVGEVSGEQKTERDIMEMAAGVQEVTA